MKYVIAVFMIIFTISSAHSMCNEVSEPIDGMINAAKFQYFLGPMYDFYTDTSSKYGTNKKIESPEDIISHIILLRQKNIVPQIVVDSAKAAITKPFHIQKIETVPFVSDVNKQKNSYLCVIHFKFNENAVAPFLLHNGLIDNFDDLDEHTNNVINNKNWKMFYYLEVMPVENTSTVPYVAHFINIYGE